MSEHGNLALKVAPRPADINLNGHIFGGWILSQMDIAGGITAARHAGGPVATVAVEGMKFLAPIEIGDVVSCYTEILRVGRTSIRVCITVIAERGINAEQIKVTEGQFIFVALGEDGRPRPVNASS